MRKPIEREIQIDDLLAEMDAAQLTAVLKRVETLREKKLSEAKRDLIARFREELASLGLDINEVITTAPDTKGYHLPIDWEARVIRHLETHNGRSYAKGVNLAVWPKGGAGAAASVMLRGKLLEMVERGTLVLLRKGARGVPTLYGLASMVEE